MMNDSMFKIWQIKLIIQRDVDKGILKDCDQQKRIDELNDEWFDA